MLWVPILSISAPKLKAVWTLSCRLECMLLFPSGTSMLKTGTLNITRFTKGGGTVIPIWKRYNDPPVQVDFCSSVILFLCILGWNDWSHWIPCGTCRGLCANCNSRYKKGIKISIKSKAGKYSFRLSATDQLKLWTITTLKTIDCVCSQRDDVSSH